MPVGHVGALAGADQADILFDMKQNVARVLSEAEQLSMAEREELTDLLVEGLVRDVAPEVQLAHISEVRRRIAEVESGRTRIIPGEAALKQVRLLVESARKGM